MEFLDKTTLRYVEPGAQQWDGTESTDKLVNTNHMGKFNIKYMV